MKIFLLLLLLTAMTWWASDGSKVSPPSDTIKTYHNASHGYQINWPDKYKLDDTRIDLVSLHSDFAVIRINSGCFDYGLENLLVSKEAISINGLPALKESFYSDNSLRMIRYTLQTRDKCFYLDILSQTELGWQDAIGVVQSFIIP